MISASTAAISAPATVYEIACREVAEELKKEGVSEPESINRVKKEVSARYRLPHLPRNSDVLKFCDTGSSSVGLRERLKRKRMRTASGVAPVAVMTSPHPCPHGRCIMCPGGPYSRFGSPQSYVGREPAAIRAAQCNYDPYLQVTHRLRQLEEIGHDPEKVELILMGGTLTARARHYQSWFVHQCLRALDDFSSARSHPHNRDRIRNTGITFETRPDYAREAEIDLMLELGATKVELGVQHVKNDILAEVQRGHSVEDTVEATRKLRNSGLKVGYHVMLGLPGSSIEDDKRMFECIFHDPRFMPDYLKIYPTLVVEGTGLYERWKRGEYRPVCEDEAIEVIAYAKKIIPPWVRIQRIQRDIPAQFIVAGVKKSNLRQLVQARIHELGYRCRCIRCREAGLALLRGRVVDEESIKLVTEEYEASGGTEYFISYEDVKNDILIAHLRLRLPHELPLPHRAELLHAAIIRDLHVYGELVPLGEKKEHSWQHRGYGTRLLRRAEEIAADKGYRRVAVMSGIGVRTYYARHGYRREGPYMVRDLC